MRRTSMLRPIINGLLVSALVMLALAVNVALAEQRTKRVNRAPQSRRIRASQPTLMAIVLLTTSERSPPS